MANLASFVIELSEAGFQSQVTALAENLGWHWMHVVTTGTGRHFPIRGSMGKGWPDLFLAKPGQSSFFAELKKEKEQLKPDQVAVLALLSAAGCEVHIWRPSQFPEIVERLSR